MPLFINKIPVPMANDAYPIAILISFAIHYYFPVVWEVVTLSPMVKVRNNIIEECVLATEMGRERRTFEDIATGNTI